MSMPATRESIPASGLRHLHHALVPAAVAGNEQHDMRRLRALPVDMHLTERTVGDGLVPALGQGRRCAGQQQERGEGECAAVHGCSFPLFTNVLDQLRQALDLLLAHQVHLLMQQLDLQLGLEIDVVVLLSPPAVDGGLPVLRHHDDRRGVGGLERQREIEQDERIGVPGPAAVGVDRDPQAQHQSLRDDEAPRPHHRRHQIGDPLAQRQALQRYDRARRLAPPQPLAGFPVPGRRRCSCLRTPGLPAISRVMVRRMMGTDRPGGAAR